MHYNLLSPRHVLVWYTYNTYAISYAIDNRDIISANCMLNLAHAQTVCTRPLFLTHANYEGQGTRLLRIVSGHS